MSRTFSQMIQDSDFSTKHPFGYDYAAVNFLKCHGISETPGYYDRKYLAIFSIERLIYDTLLTEIKRQQAIFDGAEQDATDDEVIASFSLVDELSAVLDTFTAN